LEFIAARARPNTVRAYAHDLKIFFTVVAKEPAEVTSRDVLSFVTQQRRVGPWAQVTHGHFEDYKRWLARRPGKHGALSATTISCRLGLLRTFFERIIEWGYDDAPARS